MGVWPAMSVLFAVGGELSFCINDLAECRGALDEVARQVSLNYRGVTSGSMLIEEVI
jgi:hypothetical protein